VRWNRPSAICREEALGRQHLFHVLQRLLQHLIGHCV
jgi:hypothetical protein